MWSLVFLVLGTFSIEAAEELLQEKVKSEEADRNSKIFSVFQVVRFPNDVCEGSSRNGTCFTAEECSSKNGVSDGSCASGFGVCCIVTLGCGGTSAENNSYIVQSSTTTSPANDPSTSCTYQICPCSKDVCRIRYDFTQNVLATQVQGSTSATDNSVSAADNYAIGDCVTDHFSISAPGATSSPVICGYNTGQHMILDSLGTDCQTVNVFVGESTTTTRQWDIFVTQYTCTEEDVSGPPGCLQYYTDTTGLFKNFGYPSSNSASSTPSTTTHLQNQNYEICFRRASGNCYICYASWNSIQATASFGLSVPLTDADNSAHDSNCLTDYLMIPGATSATIAATTTPAVFKERFCGRHFTISVAATEATVCSRSYPFRVGVNTDNAEVCSANSAANTCESNLTIASRPGGILGFALAFEQSSC